MLHFKTGHNEDAGFTLAELLVVLAILSLALLVTAPAFGRALSSNSNDTQLARFQFSLEQARRRAVRRGEEVVFRLNVETGAYGVDGTSVNGELPEEWAIDVIAARSEQFDSGDIGIRYWPSGASTGGSITITYENNTAEFEVDWLTGITRQLEADFS